MAFAGPHERPEFRVAEASEEDKQAAEERRRRAAAAAIVGGTLVVVGDPDKPVSADVPAAPVRAAAAGTILSALVAFLAAQRARMRGWLREQMRKRAPAASPDDIERLIAEEERRQAAFEQKQAARFARDLTTALAIPDAARREGAIRGLTAREERYARQRDEAMAARAFAAVDRVVLRGQSPTGAFWELDPTVIEHTAGCLIMGGKFWPWQVLDRVHPPRHHGCPCRLRGYGEAIAKGLLSPGAVLDVQTAVRRAAHVVMEGALIVEPEDGDALIEAAGGRELMEMRVALMAAGLVENEGALDERLSEAFDPKQPRDPGGEGGGRWIKGVASIEGSAPKVLTAVWGAKSKPGAKRPAKKRTLHFFEGEPRDTVFAPGFWQRERISIEGAARVEGANIRVVQARRNEFGEDEDEGTFASHIRREAVEKGHVTAEEAALANRFDDALLSAPGRVTFRQVSRWEDSKGGGDSSELSIPVLDRPAHYYVALHELAHHVLKHTPETKRVGREFVTALDPEKELEAWRWAFEYENRKIGGSGVPVDDETRAVVKKALASYGASADTVLPPKIAEEFEFVEEAFDPQQARWPKGHPRAGQWRPKIGADASGRRSSQGWLAKDIGELKGLLEPKLLGHRDLGNGEREPIYSRPEQMRPDELSQVGASVAKLAERYGTWNADRQRIDALHFERRALADAKSDRIEAAGGHTKLHGEWEYHVKGRGPKYTEWIDERFSTTQDSQRMRDIDAEVARLLLSEERGKREALVGVLSQLRPMGGAKLRTGAITNGSEERDGVRRELDAPASMVEEHMAALRDVERLLPRSWIEDSNAKGAVDYELSTERAWHLLRPASTTPQENALDELQSRGHTFFGYWRSPSTGADVPVVREPEHGDLYAVWPSGTANRLDHAEDLAAITQGPRRAPTTDSKIRVGRGDRSTLLHELAHRIEGVYGEEGIDGHRPLERATQRFLRARAGDAETKPLAELYPKSGYEENEKTWEDSFIDAYVGKDYAGRASEVLTMGLQFLYFPTYGREFDPPASRTNAKRDLGHRDLILGLLAAM